MDARPAGWGSIARREVQQPGLADWQRERQFNEAVPLGERNRFPVCQVNNLANTLYAEAANAGFFRPEPKRNVVVALRSSF